MTSHSECRASEIRVITHDFQHRNLFCSWISFCSWCFSLWHTRLSPEHLHILSVSFSWQSLQGSCINDRRKLICKQSSQCLKNGVLYLSSILEQISLEILKELVVKVVKKVFHVQQFTIRTTFCFVVYFLVGR